MNWKEIDDILSEELSTLKKKFVLCDNEEKLEEIKDEIRAAKWELECHREDGCEL
tara:strand:+ start:252 stop:416 length:165 start_codon:yes stop_codon:yes gene_type:complete